MLQMADARTSGTAVTRIFSILEVNGRDETKAFDYMKKLRPNVQLYTKSGGGGTLPVGLGQAGGGIFFIVDALDTKAKGYDVTISFPQEGIGTAAEGSRSSRAPRIRARQEAHRLGDLAGDAGPVREVQDQLRAGASGVSRRAEPRRSAQGREDLRHRCRLCRRQPQAHRRSLDRRSLESLGCASAEDRNLTVPGDRPRHDPASAPDPSSPSRALACGCCSRFSWSIRSAVLFARMLADQGAVHDRRHRARS
jgi:hypothetical protein